MYNKHLYCLTMSTTLKIVDMRLDKDEVSFLEKNKIKHEQKKDLIGTFLLIASFYFFLKRNFILSSLISTF